MLNLTSTMDKSKLRDTLPVLQERINTIFSLHKLTGISESPLDYAVGAANNAVH
jgi:hypothetical protein